MVGNPALGKRRLRTIGLIGGMSWVSTRSYYEWINKQVQARVHPHASAPLLIESLDFSRMYRITEQSGWDAAARLLAASARRLEGAGAGAILIGANSMHRVYDQVAAAVDVPVIHIAHCIGEKMQADGIRVAALLGTRNVTMDRFYYDLLAPYGVSLLPPDRDEAERLDRIVYDEVMRCRTSRDSHRALKTMIAVKQQHGAKGVLLACTELNMIVDVDSNVLPVYDSVRIHAERAADWILEEAEQLAPIAFASVAS
jgi:aspartate racemase